MNQNSKTLIQTLPPGYELSEHMVNRGIVVRIDYPKEGIIIILEESLPNYIYFRGNNTDPIVFQSFPDAFNTIARMDLTYLTIPARSQIEFMKHVCEQFILKGECTCTTPNSSNVSSIPFLNPTANKQ